VAFSNATLYEKLNFNFIRDIAPVASIIRETIVMLVNPSVPAKSVPEFVNYAKANPGHINFASGGNGTPGHVVGELFKMMAGVNLVHVPYRGGASAMTDLLAGRVQVMFNSPSISIEHIRAGKLRALAVTTATRSEALPDVPTVGDFLSGFEASVWIGVGAPKSTPAEIITYSTRRSAPPSPIPRRRPSLPTWASRRSCSRPPTWADSSPTKPKSGAR
jgi:tripartite-type tricarboxylate transporter receptor subunit TctC